MTYTWINKMSFARFVLNKTYNITIQHIQQKKKKLDIEIWFVSQSCYSYYHTNATPMNEKKKMKWNENKWRTPLVR